jgi:hypothetical protein
MRETKLIKTRVAASKLGLGQPLDEAVFNTISHVHITPPAIHIPGPIDLRRKRSDPVQHAVQVAPSAVDTPLLQLD